MDDRPRGYSASVSFSTMSAPMVQVPLGMPLSSAMFRQVSVDKHGRLSLPDEFCQQLKLAGNVTLSGVVEAFELWNTTEWDAAQAAQKAASDPLLADLGL